MGGTASGERRLDLRITEADYKRLRQAARADFRSVPGEARFILVNGLRGRNGKLKGGS